MSRTFRNHLALFGGAFNPPHSGHVAAMEGLLRNPGVSRVLAVPSFGTPLKTVGVPFQDRLEMARLAFSRFAEVSDIEAREGITFTWQLLERFQAGGEPVAFVIGTDQFVNLRSWARFPGVLSLCDWIVLLRKPGGLEPAQGALQELLAQSLLSPGSDAREWRISGSSRILRFVETEAPEVSATRIRSGLEGGKKDTVRELLPQAVFEFIERKHLYGT